MNRSVVDRLRDIVRAANLTIDHAGGLDARALTEQDLRRDAALFRISVIGEAASHLPPEVQALAPEIPWIRVKDMRNHIVHGYWQIDYVIVVRTIETRLGPLKVTAARLIELVERSER